MDPLTRLDGLICDAEHVKPFQALLISILAIDRHERELYWIAMAANIVGDLKS